MAKGDHLRCGAYYEPIRQEVPEEVLALLSQMGHFRNAYEIKEKVGDVRGTFVQNVHYFSKSGC
jgi:hypothetical protein